MIKTNKQTNFFIKITFVFFVFSIFSLPKTYIEATTLYSGGLIGVYNLDRSTYTPGSKATVSGYITADFPDIYRVYSYVSSTILHPGDFNSTNIVMSNGPHRTYMYLPFSDSFTVPSVEKNYHMNITIGALDVQASNGITYNTGGICDLSGQLFCGGGGLWTVNIYHYMTANTDGYLYFNVKKPDALTLAPYVDNGAARNGASSSKALNPGETTYLLWDASGVDYCTYNGTNYETVRNLSTRPLIPLSPSQTTTYSMTCTKN